MHAARHQRIGSRPTVIDSLVCLVPSPIDQPLQHEQHEQHCNGRGHAVVVGQQSEGQSEHKEQEQSDDRRQADGQPGARDRGAQCGDNGAARAPANQRLGRGPCAENDQHVEAAHDDRDQEPEDMRGAAILIHQRVIADEADQCDHHEEHRREKPRQAARLAIGQINQAGGRFVGAQHNANGQCPDAPADQHIGREYDQANRDPGVHQPMPTVDEHAAENAQPSEIAQQKLQQQPQARFLGPQPQEATNADAEGTPDDALGQQCKASGECNPAEIDEGAKGGALAIERAPFARERAGCFRQHVDVVDGFVFELDDDLLQPALGAHHIVHRRRRGSWRVRASGRSHRRQQPQKQHEA